MGRRSLRLVLRSPSRHPTCERPGLGCCTAAQMRDRRGCQPLLRRLVRLPASLPHVGATEGAPKPAWGPWSLARASCSQVELRAVASMPEPLAQDSGQCPTTSLSVHTGQEESPQANPSVYTVPRRPAAPEAPKTETPIPTGSTLPCKQPPTHQKPQRLSQTQNETPTKAKSRSAR